MPWDQKVPFNKDTGNMLNYPNRNSEWRRNCIFTDKLRFIRSERGRSAINFIFKSLITGTEYTMFLTDFVDILVSEDIKKGIIDGDKQYTFTKRGQNYGIKMVFK